jgi:hypothetical protein
MNQLQINLRTLALLVFALTSCSSPADKQGSAPSNDDEARINEEKSPAGQPYHLNVPELIAKQKEIFLSGIAKSVKYIPLETSNNYLIGEKTVKVKPTGDFIFIGEHGNPIGVFDLNGKFLYTIGKIGRGPGEYNFDYDFWPDETTQKVHIENTNVRGITSFSFKGEYLGDIVTEPKSMKIVPLGGDKFLSWNFMQEKYDEIFFRLFFIDNKGTIFKRVAENKKEYDFSRGISMMLPLYTQATDGVLYNSWEDEKIMKAKKDGSFEPALSWDLGKLKIPFNGTDDYERYKREKHKYVQSFNAWESEAFFYISFNYKNHINMALLNKKNGDFVVAANPDTVNEGIYNDIDGGPSFWPYWYCDRGKRFFRLVQAIDFIEMELPVLRNTPLKDPDALENLRSLQARLKEDSNPVVMVVELF